jgi:hypothetical protein
VADAWRPASSPATRWRSSRAQGGAGVAARAAARGARVFAATPMPDTRLEEWRYTDIGSDAAAGGATPSRGAAPVSGVASCRRGSRADRRGRRDASAPLVQVDASVVQRELPEELARQGVIFTQPGGGRARARRAGAKHLGTAVTPEDGKFAALNAAFWTGGTFLYVPKDVRVEVPLRLFRWITASGTALFSRTLVVAEEFAEVAAGGRAGLGRAGGGALQRRDGDLRRTRARRSPTPPLQRFGAACRTSPPTAWSRGATRRSPRCTPRSART